MGHSIPFKTLMMVH